MKNTPTAAMRDWRQRWQRVAEKEAELLRATPDEVRLRQFRALFATAKSQNWEVATPAETANVRRRWRVLKEKYREQNRTSR